MLTTASSTWLSRFAPVITILPLLNTHFKLVTEGFHPPLGEAYVPTESARGELAYYVVSDGGSMPYRVKIRTPEFVNIQSLRYAAKGHQFADFIAILATLDPVLGGIDR
jgi:NADH-quinone oxidoreductase subunit D